TQDGLDTVADLHLSEHSSQIMFDRAGIDAQELRDLIVREALREMAQHLLIPRCKGQFPVFIRSERSSLVPQQQACCQSWRNIRLSLMDALKCGYQLSGVDSLEDVTVHADAKGLRDIILVAGCR